MITFPLGFIAGTIVGGVLAVGFLGWWLYKSRDWFKGPWR